MDQQDIDARALDWVVRLGDPGFADWADFQTWLEADARHADAYHALSVDLDAATALVPAEPVAEPEVIPADAVGRRRRWPLWGGGAIAASLALVAGYAVLDPRQDLYAVATPAGTIRTVALADGSRVTLGGATEVTLDRNDPRVATLAHGQAMFVVRHDAADPFVVNVGRARLVDIGTAFDVKRAQGRTHIAVSEGAVDYDAGAGATRLSAGEALVATDADRSVTRYAVDADGVGSWRNSVLVYENAPLAEVADDLSRALAVDLRADPAVAARTYSGSIATARIGSDPRRIGGLLGVGIARRGDHWVMTARS